MPVKLGSKLLPESAEARIEIIPLIDIMFFLLAAFMLVSLSLVNMKSIKVNLPTVTAAAAADTRKDFVNISVDQGGLVFLDKKPVGHHELALLLTAARKTNEALRVFISGDKDVRHGEVIQVLDLVRSVGIEKVAFEIREMPPTAQP
jgi:biopolymer transport protein ExbD